MNQKFIVASLVVIVIVAAGGIFFWFRLASQTPNPPSQSNQQGGNGSPYTPVPSTTATVSAEEQKKVETDFSSQIASDNTDNVKTYQTVIVGEYALQVWKGDNLGGEALMKYDAAQKKWTLITSGGGAWSVEGLVAAGVPEATAEVLLQGVPH